MEETIRKTYDLIYETERELRELKKEIQEIKQWNRDILESLSLFMSCFGEHLESGKESLSKTDELMLYALSNCVNKNNKILYGEEEKTRRDYILESIEEILKMFQ